jgi:hypothetical protein
VRSSPIENQHVEAQQRDRVEGGSRVCPVPSEAEARAEIRRTIHVSKTISPSTSVFRQNSFASADQLREPGRKILEVATEQLDTGLTLAPAKFPNTDELRLVPPLDHRGERSLELGEHEY